MARRWLLRRRVAGRAVGVAVTYQDNRRDMIAGLCRRSQTWFSLGDSLSTALRGR